MKGRFIVITGPSAAGKTMLVDELVRRVPHSARLITVTTRAPRQNERDGEDYTFVTREEFEKRLAAGDFFEHATVYGQLYGSSKKVLDEYLETYRYVFAVIDVQGARTLKQKLPEATVLFLQPDSLAAVKRRLQTDRMGVPSSELDRRVEVAAEEIKQSFDFDYSIKNVEGEFEHTVEETMKVLGLK